MSRNKKEIHGPDSFISPFGIEIQISAAAVFFAGEKHYCCTSYYKFVFSNGRFLAFLLKGRCFLNEPILKFRAADLLYKRSAKD